MSRKSNDAKFQLGEPWASKLADFCEAHYGAPAKNIIRAALDAFIDAQLEAEPETRRRYFEARERRQKAGKADLSVISRNGDD